MIRFAIPLLLLCACYQLPGEDPGADGPGSDAWGSKKVTCSKSSECNSSEACVDNVCQLEICTDGPYLSSPPIGKSFVFSHDRELIVGGDSGGLIGYEPGSGGGFSRTTTWSMSGISDMAGGNVFHARPEEFIVARVGSTELSIIGSQGAATLFDVGFVPIAIAAGDTDAGGLDEVAVLGTTSVKLCNLETGQCQLLALEGGTGIDIAVADVDGDSRDEVIVLKSTNTIMVINLDAAETGQQERYNIATEAELTRISAGDLDGDGIAEIVGLEDGGCFLFCDDDLLHVYHVTNETSSHDGPWLIRNDDVLDIEIGDMDGDREAELVLLREGKRVRSLKMVGAGQFSTASETVLDVASDPSHLALADIDGDSPLGKLVSGPDMVPGRPVPLFAAFYPPYWREHSETPANVYVGDSDLETESHVETISLHTGYEVGAEVNLIGAFKAGLALKIDTHLNRTTTKSTVKFVGNRLWTQATPDIYGPNYGAVMVAYSCYHSYTYEMDDPADITNGGGGSKFSIVVPVDGKTAVLSTMRYNAIAEALGGLPIIQIPHTIGDPTTYPSQMETLAGGQIPAKDIVVAKPPTYVASEVGFIGFWLALWKLSGTEESITASVAVQVSGSVPGFKASVERGTSTFRSHRIEIGRETVFGGMLPTLIDDPTTPEDEYAENLYSFSPIVYREHYTDATGNTSGYFVFHYMVGL